MRAYIILIVGLLFISCNQDTTEITQEGKKLCIEGKFQEAISLFDESISKNPKDTTAYFLRGRAKMELKSFELAIPDFNKVIELNEEAFFAKYFRGLCYGVLNQWDLGYRDFDFVIKNPKFNENNTDNSMTTSQKSIAHSSRGICAVGIGNINQAVSDLKLARQYDANNTFINDLIKFLGVNTIEGTIECLIDVNWVYPTSNPLGAWKFSANGTFNCSTKLFGLGSSWGVWEVSEPGKVKIIYTKSTLGVIPENTTLIMKSCESLMVGSTEYSKK
jgi:tetratricopeptide (TPR) repeat protein